MRRPVQPVGRGAGMGRRGPPVAGFVVAGLLALLGVGHAFAGEIHVAAGPAGRAAGGADGSAARPFPSVEAALAAGVVEAGDRLILGPGAHGVIRIVGHRFEAPVTVEPAAGAEVRAAGIQIAESANLRIRGIGVWPETPAPHWRALVHVARSAADIELERLDIRSAPDAPGYLGWSAEDWLGRMRHGAMLEGTRIALRDSRIRGAQSGIVVGGPHAEIVGNLVEGFSGDGMVGLGDHGVFRGNTVRDCIHVDDTHRDGFQSWTIGADGRVGTGVVTGVVIDGNRFLEWAGPRDHPLRCELQGIGLFDGRFEGWVIQNNLVAVSHWHGIAIYGADDPRILHNTVVHVDGARGQKPWIRVASHKNGTPSRGGVVANNIAMNFVLEEDRNPALRSHRNVVLSRPTRVLRDPFGGDFRLLPDAGSVDAADPRYATEADVDGTPRPLGDGADVGAFEVR